MFAFVLGEVSHHPGPLPPDLYTLGTEFEANSSTAAFAAAAPFAAVLIGLSLISDLCADEPLRPHSRSPGSDERWLSFAARES